MSQHCSKDFVPLRKGPKQSRYLNVKSAMQKKIDTHSHPISNFSNFISFLRQEFQWWWVGIYWVTRSGKEDEHLILGQFQGPPATTILYKNKGVCGTSWATKKSIVLQDVQKFEGHIACSSVSKAQIAIPIIYAGSVIGILDIDAANYGQFTQVDERQLQKLLLDLQNLNQFQWFAKNI